jgi:hypothetical protein
MTQETRKKLDEFDFLYKRQTAVEWLVNTVFGKNGLILYSEIIQQAKEMEKKQILESYKSAFMDNEIDVGNVDWSKILNHYWNTNYNK